MAVIPCTTTPVVHGVVTFDPAVFKAAFPEFATIANPVLTINFGLAELVLTNSCSSIVANATKRDSLLNLLVAHITQLRNGTGGNAAGGVVGRINSATEGSVSVGAELPTTYSQGWFAQTQWGLLFWQATASYRQMRYYPSPCRPCVSRVYGCACGVASCGGGCVG